MQPLVAAQFSLDAIPDESFTGFASDEWWNGFACPWFEKDAAERVLNSSLKNGYRWRYETEADTFYVWNVDDLEDFAPEEFRGQQVVVDGMSKRLYRIGAYSWVWQMLE